MKYQLPKTTNSNEGFTLIELLIAITIVAILSVIGFSVFTNIQRGARDSQRRVEIDAMAKSLEATFNPATRVYVYDSSLFGQDFPTIKPADPLRSAGADGREYCIALGTTATT